MQKRFSRDRRDRGKSGRLSVLGAVACLFKGISRFLPTHPPASHSRVPFSKQASVSSLVAELTSLSPLVPARSPPLFRTESKASTASLLGFYGKPLIIPGNVPDN